MTIESMAAGTHLGKAVARGAIAGRSHRLHRPRGGFCGRGYCQQCPLASGGLACETPAGEGHPRGTDLRRPLGLAGEWMEPWFYERRFLRPGFARQWYLEILRRLSSAERLPNAAATAANPPLSMTADVLVAGGGPAGVASAAAAARRGAAVVLATRGVSGGSLPQDADTRQRVALDLHELHGRGSVTILEGALVAGHYEDDGRFVIVSSDGPRSIRADRCVIATGAYDRPLLLPGADLPGVVGLRGFQLLAAEEAFRGRSVGALGSVAELDRVAATTTAFNLELRWTLGPSDRTVARVAGRRRVCGVDLVGGERLRADFVVIATTQPTYELQIHLGGTARFDGIPPVIRAEVPPDSRALVVGEAAGWTRIGGTGERAAAAVDSWLAGGRPDTEERSPANGLRVLDSADGVVCLCEDVRRRDLDRAIQDGFNDLELVKRRSGASTGACQGKLCLCLLAEAFADRGLAPTLPTVRPPIRPIPVARLAGQP